MKKFSRKQYSAFTLLEVIIVLFIISIVTAIIIMPAEGKHSYSEMDSFAKLIKAQMQVAREQSIFEMTVLGLSLNDKKYEFYQYHEKPKPAWIALKNTDSFWHSYIAPDDVQMYLITQSPINLNSTNESLNYPRIIFLPSGEITPFTLTIHSKHFTHDLQIIGRHGGSITIVEQT